jgi:hypothetical protein
VIIFYYYLKILGEFHHFDSEQSMAGKLGSCRSMERRRLTRKLGHRMDEKLGEYPTYCCRDSR